MPDGGRRLADGPVVIDAGVEARLLGVRLLRLDASLTVAPARVVAPPAPPSPRPLRADQPIGAGLAVARRLLDDGAASLAASRARTMPARGRPEADPAHPPPAGGSTPRVPIERSSCRATEG
jgi:hypothetical protein